MPRAVGEVAENSSTCRACSGRCSTRCCDSGRRGREGASARSHSRRSTCTAERSGWGVARRPPTPPCAARRASQFPRRERLAVSWTMPSCNPRQFDDPIRLSSKRETSPTPPRGEREARRSPGIQSQLPLSVPFTRTPDVVHVRPHPGWDALVGRPLRKKRVVMVGTDWILECDIGLPDRLRVDGAGMSWEAARLEASRTQIELRLGSPGR